MAEPRIYQASLASLVAVNGRGAAIPLGLVTNIRLTREMNIEDVPEFGNFYSAAMLTHSVRGTFSWDKSYGPGVDLVGQGLMPNVVTIPQFQPFFLRVIDQLAQRVVAEIIRALVETCVISADARARLLQNVTGRCIDVLFESEVN